MKKTPLAINLGWNNPKKDKLNNYINYINWCGKNNVKLIRIIFCKWGINCIYNRNDIKLLIKIIEYANLKKIKIILVLLNFTDFNLTNYLELDNMKFSWNTNKYKDNYKSVSQFFKTIDLTLLEDIEFVLERIQELKNIAFIEIMNEIDQVNCNRKILVDWCNNIISSLNQKYPNYIYSCSISNFQNGSFFRENLNCYVDLHSYSFPTNSAFVNLQYIKSFNHDLLYVGEYAKNSNSPHLDDYETKIYFTSGLWGSDFLKLKYSAMSWWWDEIIKRKEYQKIITFYNNNIFEFKNIKKVKVNKKNIYIILKKRNDNAEINKIIERTKNLLKHPLFIFKEMKNIKKLLAKKVSKEEDVLIYELDSNSKKIYYIECNVKVEIDFKIFFNNFYYNLYDLVNCKKIRIKTDRNEKLPLFGCYILEEE